MALPTAIVSALKWGAVLSVMTLALVTYRQTQQDARNLRDTLITTSAEKITAQARSQELKNANVVLQSALEITREAADTSRIAVEALNKQFAEARIDSQTQTDVLEDVSRLQLLANKKTDRIMKLSNQATRARFDELENLFNDTGE